MNLSLSSDREANSEQYLVAEFASDMQASAGSLSRQLADIEVCQYWRADVSREKPSIHPKYYLCCKSCVYVSGRFVERWFTKSATITYPRLVHAHGAFDTVSAFGKVQLSSSFEPKLLLTSGRVADEQKCRMTETDLYVLLLRKIPILLLRGSRGANSKRLQLYCKIVDHILRTAVIVSSDGGSGRPSAAMPLDKVLKPTVRDYPLVEEMWQGLVSEFVPRVTLHLEMLQDAKVLGDSKLAKLVMEYVDHTYSFFGAFGIIIIISSDVGTDVRQKKKVKFDQIYLH
jgi:hypothetical protein